MSRQLSQELQHSLGVPVPPRPTVFYVTLEQQEKHAAAPLGVMYDTQQRSNTQRKMRSKKLIMTEGGEIISIFTSFFLFFYLCLVSAAVTNEMPH